MNLLNSRDPLRHAIHTAQRHPAALVAGLVADRDALVLRFFQDQDLRRVGSALGIGEDAAQKRVSRALERLRELLAKRGVTSTASALAIVLAANTLTAAPAGLSGRATSAALAGLAVGWFHHNLLKLMNSIAETRLVAVLGMALITAAVAQT
jgi:hypothetical protein